MAGIAGIVNAFPRPVAPMVEGLTRPLLLQPTSRAESWNDDRAAMCRVDIGTGVSRPQPIFNRDGTKCIVFYGECFDYDAQRRDLMQRGHTFAEEDDDAEFCLKLYEEHGDGAFSTLDGSFCFAILDSSKGEAILVSDRMGTRPLFYGLTRDGSLVFATQVSAVLSVPGIDRQLDTSAVIEFCCLQRVVGTKTYHKGVRMLAPASALRYHAGKATLAPYWHFNYRPQAASANEYAHELADVLRRMGHRLMRGNPRVAMLLSGGLDARMALAAAEEQLECYTFGDYLNPEATTAQAIANARGFPFHFLTRDPDHYPNLVDRAVEIGNGMYGFNHAHGVGFVERIAAECDVITHGFAPELLFRGPNLPKLERRAFGVDLEKQLDPTLNERNLPQRMFRRSYSLLGTRAVELFSPSVRKTLDETLLASAQEMISQAAKCSSNVYDQFLWPDVYYHSRYPSMLFELCLRPFMKERSLVFGNEVLDLHLKMPVAMRKDNTVWLKAVALLNSKVAKVVNANTGFSPTTPAAVQSGIRKAKSKLRRLPFAWRFANDNSSRSVPAEFSPRSWPRFDRMIRENERLRQLIVDTLGDREALPADLFDHEQIKVLLDDHLAERGQYRIILFGLLTFGRWHKKHGGD